MNIVRNIYKARVICYNDEAYNLPLDVVYFIASSWNFRLNNYVYAHKAEIEQLLRDDIGGYFPYRLEIISYVDLLPIYADTPDSSEKTFQTEVLKRMMDKTPRFDMSFIARIAPSEKDKTFGFYSIDVSLCAETIVPAILQDFICDLTQLNSTALSIGMDYSDSSIHEKVCHIESRFVSFTGDPKMDPTLRELASRIKQEIDDYQQKNGQHRLLRILGNDFIKSIEGLQPKPLSLLKVDQYFNIILPEYDIDIKMHTLPKTIYIFFLRHPQGIKLKDLSYHRQELTQIYLTLTRRNITHEEAFQKIEGILDFTNGHLNQYLCRISESFRKKLSSDLAEKYSIQGKRNGIRRILLQPDLILLPEKLKF